MQHPYIKGKHLLYSGDFPICFLVIESRRDFHNLGNLKIIFKHVSLVKQWTEKKKGRESGVGKK